MFFSFKLPVCILFGPGRPLLLVPVLSKGILTLHINQLLLPPAKIFGVALSFS